MAAAEGRHEVCGEHNPASRKQVDGVLPGGEARGLDPRIRRFGMNSPRERICKQVYWDVAKW